MVIKSVIHKRLRDKLNKASLNGKISIKKARTILGYSGVSRDMFKEVIDEMEKVNYLRMNKNHIRINRRGLT